MRPTSRFREDLQLAFLIALICGALGLLATTFLKKPSRVVSNRAPANAAVKLDPELKMMVNETALRCLASYRSEACVAVLAYCGKTCMAMLPEARLKQVRKDYWAMMERRELVYPEERGQFK